MVELKRVVSAELLLLLQFRIAVLRTEQELLDLLVPYAQSAFVLQSKSDVVQFLAELVSFLLLRFGSLIW